MMYQEIPECATVPYLNKKEYKPVDLCGVRKSSAREASSRNTDQDQGI